MPEAKVLRLVHSAAPEAEDAGTPIPEMVASHINPPVAYEQAMVLAWDEAGELIVAYSDNMGGQDALWLLKQAELRLITP